MYGIFLCLNLFIWGSRRPFTRSFDVFYKVLCFSLSLAFINVVTRTRTSRSSKLWKICFKNKQSLWPKSNDRRRIMQINSNLDANFCNQSRFSAFSSLKRSSVQLMWKDVVFCTTRYWSSCNRFEVLPWRVRQGGAPLISIFLSGTAEEETISLILARPNYLPSREI